MVVIKSLLLVLLLMTMPALMANEVSSKEPLSEVQIEQRYQTVGDQLFCLCGCRDKLLECSHNVCSYKDNERAFLRELASNPKFSQADMKAEMVERFGPEILLMRDDGNLFGIIAGGLFLLLSSFGIGLWVITKRGQPALNDTDQSSAEENDKLDERIARELKELE